MVLSADDGCDSDLRLAELCKKYDIVCVFYWPVEMSSLALDKGYKPLSYKNAKEIAKDFEIGSHTITHRHLTQIREDEAKEEIEYSKYILEDWFDREVTKFAPPRGYTNDLLTKFTKRFYEKQRLTKGKNLVHIHPNSGANGNIGWKDRYRILTDNGVEDIECWMHSWELDKFDLWDELEEFLSEGH